MKFLLPLLLALDLVGCSPSNESPAASHGKSLQSHRYLTTFAAVKVPNESLKPYYQNNGYDFGTIHERYQFATRLLTCTNDCSVTTIDGNYLPIVVTGHGTGGKILPDARQEAADLEKTGMRLEQFEANVEVGDEDEHGSVWYQGRVSYRVHLREPVGNSTDHGGSIPFPGGMLLVGQADLQPLFATKDFTLCALVRLERVN